MRVVFAGTPQIAVPALEKIFNNTDLDLVAIISKPNNLRGRSKKNRYLPVEKFALENDIPLMQPDKPNSAEFIAQLKQLNPECCPVVGYGNILKEPLLEIPDKGWVNLHFSLLPQWRGVAPVPAAIKAGDRITGVTTFKIGPGLDDGPIYGQTTTEIKDEENSSQVLHRLANLGANLLTETLLGIAKESLIPVAQSNQDISYAPKIDKEATKLNWNLPSHIIARTVRAYAMEPGAWTEYNTQTIKIFSCVSVENPAAIKVADSTELNLSSGKVLITKNNFYVKTANGFLEILELQAPGKPKQKAMDWARGSRIKTGEQW